MSRTVLTRKEFTIVAGWDAPFRHYFANIEKPDDEDIPWYSTMDDPAADFGGGFRTLEEVRTRVEARVGPLPEEFWEAARIQDMNVTRNIEDFEEA